MRDVRIQFNGDKGTIFRCDEEVAGKSTYEQKYLINSATSKGTDPIFPDRGTDLLKGAIGGSVINFSSAFHLGNFAAVDTLYFCSFEENADEFNSEEYVDAFTLLPTEYDNSTRTLTFKATFSFKDGTSNEKELNVTYTES